MKAITQVRSASAAVAHAGGLRTGRRGGGDRQRQVGLTQQAQAQRLLPVLVSGPQLFFERAGRKMICDGHADNSVLFCEGFTPLPRYW
ncbi:hypothetical protein ACFQES_40340 [Nonomuraea salmonea]|uniref:hypothetical protein n=1 Tax=Nonomuraea salmonea TaxID=46181 RepID=UPI003620BC79